MAGPADSDCTKTSGRSTRHAATLHEGCEEWLGEQGQGEGEDMMEMGEVEDLVEIGKRIFTVCFYLLTKFLKQLYF